MQAATAKAKITRIDCVPLTAKRPRTVGRNAFSGAQGDTITEPIVRLYTDTGVVGWARSTPSPEMAQCLIGKRLEEVFSVENGTVMGYDFFDTVLWDLVGMLEGKAVHALLNGREGSTNISGPRNAGRVGEAAGGNLARVYHSAIYFEDLDPATNEDRGLEYLVEAIEEGMRAGYQEFKLKIGRGNQWMERDAGFRRDIEVIRKAREVIGQNRLLMIDSNNTFTYEEAVELVNQIRDCNIYWFEEPFKEMIEPSLRFKNFLHETSPEILLADGEGTRPFQREILAVLRASAIDVVQFDFRPVPISAWLPVLPFLEEVGVLTAPHNWASFFLNYYVPHFGLALPGYTTAETDPCIMPEVDTSNYRLVDGKLEIPDIPGFGLQIDHAAIDRRVADEGWVVTA